MRVIQIGRYPPPLGGTTIHNQRILAYCLAQGIECELVDPYGGHSSLDTPPQVHVLNGNFVVRLFRLRRMARRWPPSIVHVHISAFDRFAWAGLPMLWALRPHPALLSVQGSQFLNNYRDASPLRRFLIHRILRSYDRINVTNPEKKALIVERVGVPADRVSVTPSFLPPLPMPDAACVAELDQIAALKARVDRLLLVAGSLTPMYAIDLTLEAVQQAEQISGRRLGLVLALYDLARSYPEIAARVKALAGDHVLAFEDHGPDFFNRIVQEADIFLRPSTSDGDSNALREAIFWGRQCIASDAVPRPAGVELFATGDCDAYAGAIVRCAADESLGMVRDRMADNGEKFLALYRVLWRDAYGSDPA